MEKTHKISKQQQKPKQQIISNSYFSFSKQPKMLNYSKADKIAIEQLHKFRKATDIKNNNQYLCSPGISQEKFDRIQQQCDLILKALLEGKQEEALELALEWAKLLSCYNRDNSFQEVLEIELENFQLAGYRTRSQCINSLVQSALKREQRLREKALN